MKRWDEDHDCEVCKDHGSFTVELCGETLLGFCSCEAGDEAHELNSLQKDGWAA